MHGKDAIRHAYEMSRMVLMAYVNDMTDEEIMKRPAEGCNHVAWQLGHLITAECGMLDGVAPGYAIELPEGFADKHGRENTASDDPSEFLGKDAYLEYFGKLKEATFKALDELTEEDLQKEPPEHLKQICKNAGEVFVLIATHPMMHVGQFVPLRRKLGKPVVI